jgi:hypothetical protein
MAVGCPGTPAGSAPGGTPGSSSPGGTATGRGGRTRFASNRGSSFMVPAGPLSKTFPGEMRSSRQSFSVSPSDSTRELVPDTAKIAMRRSGPITTPVSLTSRSGDLASPAEDGTSGRSGAAGSVFAGGKRASNEGLSLLRIRPTQTTHPARHKAGKRIIYLSKIRCVPERSFIDATEPRRCSKGRNSLVLAREPRCKRQPRGSHRACPSTSPPIAGTARIDPATKPDEPPSRSS